ncbi:MAG: XdhC/CoxI family protein [candidate division KSB1 bacterium]|nr:XdhC/CoxI family protein [candidate division KSB1 bacterium]MDZ7365480.1 XdhC/CoxI family protein [candidate division KSB1 bacterium]MDZ7403473.1 XdhC/CoxI family protein [candidate division KSB1 bacterium]
MNEKIFNTLYEAIQSGEPVVLATVIRGAENEIGRHLLIRRDGSTQGNFGDPSLAARVKEQAAALFGQQASQTYRDGECEIFLESYFPPPKLIIVGAVHVAIPLVSFAKELGYKVILVDPRQTFATETRFPHVDALIRKWPDEALAEVGIDASTCIVVLTHDPKFDDPAIKYALQYSPAYIGVLGSRKTHEKRLARLKQEGLTDEQLAFLHAPIGLDLGGQTPVEIALSIMSEIVAVRRGRVFLLQHKRAAAQPRRSRAAGDHS